MASPSLCLFRSIFPVQNSTLVFGILNFLHSSCPCQKHPFTITTVLHFRITISGVPGNAFKFFLYLNPLSHRNFRTKISGLVLVERILDITSLRVSKEKISAILNNLYKGKLQLVKFFHVINSLVKRLKSLKLNEFRTLIISNTEKYTILAYCDNYFSRN